MKNNRPIFWYQGLFLQPQHFEYQELFIKSLLEPLYKHQKPFFWGVRSVDIDKESLKEGFLKVNSLEAIFQDGSVIGYPQNSIIKPRNIEQINKGDIIRKGGVKVYIALKKASKTTDDVLKVKTIEDIDRPTRFVTFLDPQEVQDIYLKSSPEAKLNFLYYNLNILLEDEAKTSGDFHTLPIAEIGLKDGNLHLIEDYIPPIIAIDSSSVLLEKTAHIKNQIHSRAKVLDNFKLIDETQKSNLKYSVALLLLSKHLSRLDFILKHPYLHPWELYGLLLEMMAEFSIFSQRINPLGRTYEGNNLLNGYNHLDLKGSFDEVFTLIDELLAEIVAATEEIIDLKRDGDIFYATIDQELLSETFDYYLYIKSTLPKDEIEGHVKGIVKVAPKHMMDTLIKRALPGMNLEYVEHPPLSIPKDDNVCYFKIKKDTHLWNELKKSSNISVFWVDAPEDLTLKLIVSKA